MLAVVELVAPQPRRGILAMLDQPTFTVQSLPPLPAGLTGFAVLSLDPGKLYDQVVELDEADQPAGRRGLRPARAGLPPAVRLRPAARTSWHSSGPRSRCTRGPRRRRGGRSGHGDARPVHRADDRGPGPRRVPGAEPRQADRGDQPDHPVAAGRRPSRPARSQCRRHRVPEAGCEAAHLCARPAPGRSAAAVMAMFRPTVELGKGQLVLAATTDGRRPGRRPGRACRPTGSGSPPARSSRWPGGCPATWSFSASATPATRCPPSSRACR